MLEIKWRPFQSDELFIKLRGHEKVLNMGHLSSWGYLKDFWENEQVCLDDSHSDQIKLSIALTGRNLTQAWPTHILIVCCLTTRWSLFSTTHQPDIRDNRVQQFVKALCQQHIPPGISHIVVTSFPENSIGLFLDFYFDVSSLINQELWFDQSLILLHLLAELLTY